MAREEVLQRVRGQRPREHGEDGAPVVGRPRLGLPVHLRVCARQAALAPGQLGLLDACQRDACGARHMLTAGSSLPSFRAIVLCPSLPCERACAPCSSKRAQQGTGGGRSKHVCMQGPLHCPSALRSQHALDAAGRHGSRARARALGGRGRLPPAGLERRAGLGRRRGGRRLALAPRHGHVRQAVLHSGDLDAVLARLDRALLARVQPARRRGRRRLLACARAPPVGCGKVLNT
jgi:hypothetical protein